MSKRALSASTAKTGRGTSAASRKGGKANKVELPPADSLENDRSSYFVTPWSSIKTLSDITELSDTILRDRDDAARKHQQALEEEQRRIASAASRSKGGKKGGATVSLEATLARGAVPAPSEVEPGPIAILVPRGTVGKPAEVYVATLLDKMSIEGLPRALLHTEPPAVRNHSKRSSPYPHGGDHAEAEQDGGNEEGDGGVGKSSIGGRREDDVYVADGEISAASSRPHTVGEATEGQLIHNGMLLTLDSVHDELREQLTKVIGYSSVMNQPPSYLFRAPEETVVHEVDDESSAGVGASGELGGTPLHTGKPAGAASVGLRNSHKRLKQNNVPDAAVQFLGATILRGRRPHVSVKPVIPASILAPASVDRPNSKKKGRPASSAKDKGDRRSLSAKGKASTGSQSVPSVPEVTVEELEENRLKEIARITSEAKKEEDDINTYAHPHLWPRINITNITFLGPVRVEGVHVIFRNCRFISTTTGTNEGAALSFACDNANGLQHQLEVTQYCQVRVLRCSFETPCRCAVYAYPWAEVNLSNCLFTGAPVPAVRGLRASDFGAHTVIDAERIHSGASSVGIFADQAKVVVDSSTFTGLGVGMVIHGGHPSFSMRKASGSRMGAGQDSFSYVMKGCELHSLFSTAVRLEHAHDVLLTANKMFKCGYYSLDIRKGSTRYRVLENQLWSPIRVVSGQVQQPQFLNNSIQTPPIEEEVSHEAKCMQPVY